MLTGIFILENVTTRPSGEKCEFMFDRISLSLAPPTPAPTPGEDLLGAEIRCRQRSAVCLGPTGLAQTLA